MVRLLIAEDEKVVRETISQIIDWQANDIELIGACENGLEAYDMIIDGYPDVVLTDIMMPGMSGLELIERAQGMDKDIEFIILSGYGEFEYAKWAMKYGVKYYLLKPCDETQILEAIQNLRMDIAKKQAARQVRKDRELLERRFDTVLKKQFTIEAVTGTEDFSTLMERYGSSLHFPVGTYWLYFIGFMEEHLLPALCKALSPMKYRYSFQHCFNSLYVRNTSILMLSMTRETDKEGFDRALAALRLPGQSVEFSVRSEAFAEVPDMLRSVIPRLQRFNRLVLIDNDHGCQEFYNYVATFQQASAAVLALESVHTQEEVEQALQPLFGDLSDVELARMVAMRLVAQTANRHSAIGDLDYSRFLSELYSLTQIADIRALTGRQLLALPGNRVAEPLPAKDFVSRAMQYVQEHLDDSRLSMKWLAENYLYMNVDYFSRRFTKQTGEKFSSYLNRVRMDRAKELILSYESDHIYKVAEQVGCGHNPQYFSQLFKKSTGMTPSQYREAYKS